MSDDGQSAQMGAFYFGWRRRIEPLLQSQNSECGIACIGMIANFHGGTLDLVDLRRMVGGAYSRGMTVTQLIALADELDLHGRAIRVEVNELRSVRLPALIHLDGNHFVVLERVGRKRFQVVDPRHGRVGIPRLRFSERFTGVVVEVFPANKFIPPQGGSRPSLLSAFGNVPGIAGTMSWLFVLALVLEATVLISPLFVQSVVDTVIANHDGSLLVAIAAAYFVLIVVQVSISSFRSWSISAIGSALLLGWSANVFRHLINLPAQYFESRTLGDVSSRFNSLGEVQRTVSTGAIEAAIDGVMATLILAVLFLYKSALAWLVLAGIATYLVLRLTALRVISESNVDVINAIARQETYFIEATRSVSLIRRLNSQGWYAAKYVDRVNDTQRKSLDLQSIQLVFNASGTLLFGGLKIAVIFLGAKAAMRGEFSAGMLIAFIFYVDQFTGRTSKLVDFVIGLKIAKIHVSRVSDITTTGKELHLNGEYRSKLDGYEVELSQVWHRYGKSEVWLIENQSLLIKQGESVAICGASGIGKSTLVKLLSGDLDPVMGSIRIGGLDIKQIGKRRFREFVSTVTQDDVLMSGSIRQNISGFSADPIDDGIIECARLAGIHDEIMMMPMRYDTLIGDLGVLVSGGQKQRICLARALYRRPKVLILDEATSHLDVALEERVFKNLAKVDCTRVIISHRPETLVTADTIFELKAGRLYPVSR